MAVAIAGAAFAAGYVLRGGGNPPADRGIPPLTRFALEPPPGHAFSDYLSYCGPALSPDGRSIVFSAGDAAESGLWLQRLDATRATELAGTADGRYPFWSPDGTQIGYFADGKIRRLVVATGENHVVCDAGFTLGASWTDDETILFSGGPGQGIQSVPAVGGTPTAVTRLAEGEFMHVWPATLTGERRFLYESIRFVPDDPLGRRSNTLRAATLDGEALPVSELTGSGQAQFVAADLLVFMHERALVARRFDPESLRFGGERAVLAEPVVRLASRGDAPFSAAPGVMLYESGIEQNALTWYDRPGRRLEAVAQPGALWALALSHDDSTVLYARLDSDSGAIRIYRADTMGGGPEPITQGPAWNRAPVFAPDDRSMAFVSVRYGPPALFVRDLTPGSEPRPLADFFGLKYPNDWTPDGSRILLMRRVPPAPWASGLSIPGAPPSGDSSWPTWARPHARA